MATQLQRTIASLNRTTNITRGPSLIELFDANRLVEFQIRPTFTFELTDTSGKLEFLFHHGDGYWNNRTEVELQGQILSCEPLDEQGRKWRVKVRFSVKFYEHNSEDRLAASFSQYVETFIDYNPRDRKGKLNDKRFVRKFMRWLEPWDANNPGGLFFNGRRVARVAEPKPVSELVLNFPIEELEIGVRVYNCLKRVGIETIGDLVNTTESRLAQIPNFGGRSVQEVTDALAKHGLKLKK